jgi:hypothetical protein
MSTLFLVSTSVKTEGTVVDYKSSLTYSRGDGGYTYSIKYERPDDKQYVFTTHTYSFFGSNKGAKIPIIYSKYTHQAQIADLYIVWRPAIIYSLFAIFFVFFIWLRRRNLSNTN